MQEDGVGGGVVQEAPAQKNQLSLASSYPLVN